MNNKDFKNFVKTYLKENFASQEFYDKEKQEAIEYLNNESGWVTILTQPGYNTVNIYKDVTGLDPERDNIDVEDIENYTELSVEEVLELVNNDVQPSMISQDSPEMVPPVEESSSTSLLNRQGKNVKPAALRKPIPKGKLEENKSIRKTVRNILFKDYRK